MIDVTRSRKLREAFSVQGEELRIIEMILHLRTLQVLSPVYYTVANVIICIFVSLLINWRCKLM